MTVADLETLGAGDGGAEAPTDESGKKITGRSPTQIAMDRLLKDKVAIVSGIIVILLFLAGLLAPLICKIWGVELRAGDPGSDTQFGFPVEGPPYYPFTWSHPLGLAPNTGNDNLAELLYGLRTSMGIAITVTILTTVVGAVLGLIAGFSRGWLDRVLSFVIDLFLSFPVIVGALAIAPIIAIRFATNESALKYAQLAALVAVLVIFNWMQLARLIRGQVLSLREREFVQAAQVMGAPTRRILFKEMLPNLVAPMIVAVSLALPAFVTYEATLSFLGIGLTGVPSLGQTINKATPFYDTYPLYLFAPVIMIMVLVLALNMLGDSVRDAFDPRTRR